MRLHYLDFDFSDEDSGRGSFDAMASVVASRLQPLLDEVAAVLRWAGRAFGPAGALDDEGEWDYDLHAIAEPDTPLGATYDDGAGVVLLGSAASAGAPTTLTLTLSGSAAFCQAFRDRFGAAQ